ncbi:MAG: hypothetical protein ACI9EF_001308 [Pseudohongiellaceae bacterium]|jgi:uncharacterized protein YndB with AHSA1/START domain
MVCSEIEPKLGGKYNHYMTLVGGFEMEGQAQFLESDPPHKFAYSSPSPDGSAAMTVTVVFSDVEGGTQVRLTHDKIPMDPGPPHLPAIIEGGWTAALSKLDTHLLSEAR